MDSVGSTVLVVGGSGATGKRLVRQLLEKGAFVRAVVRDRQSLPESLLMNPKLEVTEASLLELPQLKLEELARGCSAVASCLGHNGSLRGVFGFPRQLVTESTRRLTNAIAATNPPTRVRFVMMGTVLVSNSVLGEVRPFFPTALLTALYYLLPPHADNWLAAKYLRENVGVSHPCIDWVNVRPDLLLEANDVTPYEVYPNLQTYSILQCGKTSRVNVADFMSNLALDVDGSFVKWKNQMPAIYNAGSLVKKIGEPPHQ